MATKQKIHGEGNYDASRKYYDAARRFVDSGRVEAGVRQAAPGSGAQAAEMRQREEAVLLQAKGKKRKSPVEEPGPKPQPLEDPAVDPAQPEEKQANPLPCPGQGLDRR